MTYTDAEIVTVRQLAAIEPDIEKICTTESIKIAGPDGMIRSAMSDCGNKLLSTLVQFESYPMANGTELSANHLAAVFNLGPGARNIPRFKLQQIVASPQIPGFRSPLQTWVLHNVLIQIYRAAWNRKLKEDKYKAKLEQYMDLERNEGWPRFKSQGLPICMAPLERPAATFGFNVGTWGDANVTAVVSTGTAGGTFLVAITYVDQTSQFNTYQSAANTGNAQSAASDPSSIVVDPGSVLNVSIGSLIPPAGVLAPVGFSQGWLTPRKASGWNVWAGPAGQPLSLQNANPIPIATKTYQLTTDPVVSPYYLTDGQYADFNHVVNQVVFRA